jgi:hypothetical protein
VKHPAEGWCLICPRVILYRTISTREKRRGYIYPGGHIQSTDCRIWLDGLRNVYQSDVGAEFVIDGCEHVAFVGALCSDRHNSIPHEQLRLEGV